MNIFFALECSVKYDIGHTALSFITDNLKTHERTTIAYYYRVQSFYYIYTKMDNKKKERNRVEKYRSKEEKGFHGYKPEKVTTTTTNSESMHMQDGEEPDISLSSVVKQRKNLL